MSLRGVYKRILRLSGMHPRQNPQYIADGLAVWGKNLSFMHSASFQKAWDVVREQNLPHWKSVPDIRWRAHVCVWAAQQALRIKGDFVELGVNTGMLSSMVWRTLGSSTFVDRSFWLYDTFTGIGETGISDKEAANISRLNAAHFGSDKLQTARLAFQDLPSAKIVPGLLPHSLANSSPSRIAYLSIDLNSAAPEIESARILWPKLARGAVVVLDDYAFAGHEAQYAAWNEFASERGLVILTMPTGQGILTV